MTNAQAIILGFVQGLTEYLPVSSSAHLVLVPKIMGWHFSEAEAFVFDVLVQLGTLLGVFAYFLRSIVGIGRSVIAGVLMGRPFHNEDARLGYMLVLATIPAAIFGLTFKDYLAAYFSSPLPSCYFLIVTGFLLITAEYLGRSFKQNPGQKDAVFIGLAQSLALFPGISRSGATIAAGMLCGLPRKNAAYFSFLLSIPIMLGASAVAFSDLLKDQVLLHQLAMPLFLGFVVAAITGYLVIKWFMAFLTSQRLVWFAVYCIAIGGLGIGYWSV
jgi:undecaprenyl-diphosphatase